MLYEEGSSVTVTECEGQLYGLLQVGGEEFVLQPTPHEHDVLQPDSGHVLRRRDVLLSEQPAAYNLTGDTVTDLDIDFNDHEPMSAMHVHPRHSDHSDIDYFRNIVPISRPISGACECSVRSYEW